MKDLFPPPKPASPELRQWFEAELKKWIDITQSIISDDMTHQPIMIVFRADGEIMHVTLDMDDKDEAAYTHKLLGHHPSIKAAVTIIESWVLSKGVGKDKSLNQLRKEHKGGISDHPDREEGILFNCISHGMQLFAMSKIKRPENTLAPPVIIDPRGDDETLEGRMVL